MKRWWLGFGDLQVGDRFRFTFFGRESEFVYVKTSQRSYQFEGQIGKGKPRDQADANMAVRPLD